MADFEEGTDDRPLPGHGPSGVKALVRRLAQPPRGGERSDRVRYAAVLFGASMAVILACALLAFLTPAPLAAFMALFLWLFAVLVPAYLLDRLGSPGALFMLAALLMAALAWLAPGVLHSQALQLWGRSATAVVAEHHTQRGLAPGRRGGVARWSVQRYALRFPDGTPIRPELVRGNTLRTRSCTPFKGDPRDRRPGEPICSDRALQPGDTVAVVFDPLGLFPPMTEQAFGGQTVLLGGWLLGVGAAAGVFMWAGLRAAPPSAEDRLSQAEREARRQQRRARRQRRRITDRSRRRNRRRDRH